MTERLYLNNPYLKQVDARIVEKVYKNNKYYIKTDKTIFYPNLAGGQPGDKGTINGVEVLDTYEDGEDLVHVVRDNIHSDKVVLTIDWDNRFDYMQQHSGQHLLSAAFYKLYNGETVGFYIGKEYVYIDVNLPEINQQEIIKIEELANRIVFSNFQIKSYIVEKSDLGNLTSISDTIPNSQIRIVEIDGIDFSPCCGTHLRYTGEIGLIKIRKVEKYKGNIRVEFVCGNRALQDYIWKNNSIYEIANLLSSKDKDIANKVAKLYEKKEKLERENRSLKEEIAKYKGEELFQQAKKIYNHNFIYKKFQDMDFQEVNNITNYLFSKDRTIILFALSEKDHAQFLVGVSKDININLNSILKALKNNMEIKGGGKDKLVQGKCLIKDLDLILEEFYESILREIKV